jgi:hypothetical protein
MTDPSKKSPLPSLNFRMTLVDIRLLIKSYDEKTKELSRTIGRNQAFELSEVFKRASIVLLVTAWETFVEDIIYGQFIERVRQAKNPDDIKSAFNAVAQAWLEPMVSRRKPPDLAKWAGEGWKELILSKFTQDIRELNTPKSGNIRKLSKRYLGVDLTRNWKWRKMTANRSCEKLDELIELRGNLVHRAKRHFYSDRNLGRSQVIENIRLVQHLVRCTEAVFGLTADLKGIDQIETEAPLK